MPTPPSEQELERLGLYDPRAPNATDQLRLLKGAFALGATRDEVARALAARHNLGPLMLDLVMRPPGETKDLRDFADGEPDPVLVRRLWSALGLPESGRSPVRVTPDAALALRLMAGMTVLLGEEAALGVARVMGSSMARLAETISETFRVGVEVPDLNRGKSQAQVAEDYTRTVQDLLPMFLDGVAAVFRRHLVNVSFQTWSTDPEQTAVTFERSVCFADLVGSTESLQVLSIREIANLIRGFEEQVWDLVGASGGRVVKLIGDEAMFVLEDPTSACRVALDLIEQSEQPVRIGLAHGTVVGLYGDYYGETVNLAARLVALAGPSTLLVSEAVASRAEIEATFEAIGPQPLKGFALPVPVYRVERPGPTGTARPGT